MSLGTLTREDTRPAPRLIAGRFPALPSNLAHLAHQRRFVCWRFGSTPNGKGKYPKVPFSPFKIFSEEKPRGTYHAADTEDPETWGTFADVQAALRDWSKWFDGWGIVLMPGDVGGDLDDCVIDGELHPYAESIRAQLAGRAYLETSVSGRGMHFIALGTVEGCKTDLIELYAGGTGRFFTVSGNELDGSSAPAPAQETIDAIRRKYAPAGRRTPKAGGNTGCCAAPQDAAITEAETRKAELIESLRGNATDQLLALVKHNRFPSGMRDTSASGARSVVVAQLLRAPNRSYTDAEIVVMALEIWRRKGYEGALQGNRGRQERDIIRLIGKYRPTGQVVKAARKCAKKADGRKTRAGDVDRFYAFLRERISGPTSVKTAELAADFGISRRSAITYLDILVAEKQIFLDRTRGRNGGIVIRFEPVENVQAFCATEAPVLPAETPQIDPPAATDNTVDQDHTTTRVPSREADHILLTLAEAVKEAFDVYADRPLVVRKKGRPRRAPLHRRTIARYVESNYPDLDYTDEAFDAAIEQERHDRKLAALPTLTPAGLKAEIRLAQHLVDKSRAGGDRAWRWWSFYADMARRELEKRPADPTRPKGGRKPCEAIPDPRKVAAQRQAEMWGVVEADAGHRPLPERTSRAAKAEPPAPRVETIYHPGYVPEMIARFMTARDQRQGGATP